MQGKAQLSKKGNRRLRKSLYWPVIVAIRHNPVLGVFARRADAGKPKMVVIAAMMRKWLRIAFYVLKH